MSGMEPLAIAALAASVGGTGLNIMAQQEQADDRRSVLNRQLEQNDATSKQASGLVLNEAQNLTPQARQAALDATASSNEARTASDLAGAGGALAAVDTSGDAGNVSKDFLTAKADRAVSEGTRLTALGRELAKIRAPGQVQTQDGYRAANLGSNLSDVLGSNARMAKANSLDAESVQAPAYGALGSIASALGTAYTAGSIAKGAGAAAGGGLTSGASGLGLKPGVGSLFNWST